MIQFRCSSCGKRYGMAENRIGNLLTCTCGQHLKVPRSSGASAKYRTWGDLFIELLVYGVGGGLLGFGLGVLIASQIARAGGARLWPMIAGLTLAGFLIGGFGGERGIHFIGKMIRDREER